MTQNIALAMFGTMIIAVADDAATGGIQPRHYIGYLISFVLLAFLAQPAPQVAQMFAWLLFAVALLSKGPRVLHTLSGG